MGINGAVKFGTTEGMILYDSIPLILEHDSIDIPYAKLKCLLFSSQ